MTTFIYSFDLDSTIRDTQHRRHLINVDDRDSTDWQAYSMAAKDDGEGPAAPLLRSIIEQQAEIPYIVTRAGIAVVDFIVVSRADNASRPIVTDWLNARGWAPRALYLLRDEFDGSDERNHGLWKRNAIRDFEAKNPDCRVVLHIDDWHGVTKTLLAAGIPAMTVRGDEDGEAQLLTEKHAVEVAAQS